MCSMRILCPWFKIPTEQVSSVCAKSFQSCLLFAMLWAVACQAPLSMGFSRQEYWNGLPCPSPEDLPDPGIKSMSLATPALADEFFTTSTNWIYIYTHTHTHTHTYIYTHTHIYAFSTFLL